MNAPAFTTNPQRIERLKFNYNEGVTRERIPHEKREQMDVQLVEVNRAHILALFANAEKIQKEKKDLVNGENTL